jgi:hypothetical protein
MQHIGIGQAGKIDRIEVKWPMTQKMQVFTDVRPGATLTITEGSDQLLRTTNAKVDFSKHTTGLISCYPKR